MKSFATLLALAGFLVGLPVAAQTNIASNVQIGYDDNDPSFANTGVLGGTTLNLNYTPGSGDVSNQFYPGAGDGFGGEIADLFVPNATVTSVVFTDSLYWNGGWFGVNSGLEDGQDGNYQNTLSAAALIPPTLQVTYSPTLADGSWVTVDETDDYMMVMTGASVPINNYSDSGGAAVTSTFTLTTPVSGITGIRLIGEEGGLSYASAETSGFLGAYQMKVIAATPEPSTYAMIFGGLGMLVLVARLRRKLSA